MNVKLRVVSMAAVFFTGSLLMAQKTKKDTLQKEEKIEEVVLIGYGSQKKSDVSGAITSVKSEALQEQPVSSLELALQGKAAGVQVASTGGRSGNSTQISIRGNGSLSASNSPLYVIDGVPQENMRSVSPEDVESMEVLKDAASTAIYGSRASNGVVLIETKSGRYGRKPRVSFSTSYGLQQVIKAPNLLNASQYKQVHDVARQNYLNDIQNGILPAVAPSNAQILTPMAETGVNTRWMDYVLRTGVITNNQLSFTAGNENSKMFLSVGHINQEGIIKQDEYQISRVRLNVEQKITDKFKIGINSYYNQTNSTPVSDDNNTFQPWNNALGTPPNLAPYAIDGTINRFNFNNPLFAFEREVSDKQQDLGSNFFAVYNPIKEITLKTSVSGNLSVRRYRYFDAPNTRRGEQAGVPWGYGYYSTTNNRNYLIENTASYDKKFVNDKLKVSFLAGQSYQRWQFEDSFVQGENFPSNDLPWLVSAATINKGRSYFLQTALASFFGRAQVTWDNKYNLMLSTRYDGSSKFRKGNQWGNFPAAGFAWTASNESFFDVPFINELKFRGSYGFTGNQTGISYSSGLNLIGAGQNHNQNPGLAVTDLYNPDLIWEKAKIIDAGMDLSMFNKRLNLVVDFYDKNSNELLQRIPVPQETGFATQLKNVGLISNKGIEIGIDANIIRQDKFSWDFRANFNYNKNVIKDIGTKTGEYTTGFTHIVKEGEAMGSFYLIEALGVANEKFEYKDSNGNVTKVVQAGDMIYKDINGDGKIDTNDRQVFSGGVAPIYGGFYTRLRYGNIDLSVNSQYSVGKKVYAVYKEKQVSGGATGYPSFSENMIGEQMNYWTPENQNTNVPRPHLSSAISAWNNQRSTRFLENADYLRITDITLGLNLDTKQIGFIQSMRIYAQVRNPFTFTKYSGADPEVIYVNQTITPSQNTADTSKITAGVDLGGIPNVKVYSLGMNINF